jgi:hypothetical protein
MSEVGTEKEKEPKKRDGERDEFPSTHILASRHLSGAAAFPDSGAAAAGAFESAFKLPHTLALGYGEFPD